ncbi:hypothetical protein, partial [Bombella intestini]|uniref:hypothetical protein n=1 Tax=Bombella intestini TaxID=1539051 RepID=UPI00130157DC
QTHQQDEAIRTGQAAILEKLTEINAGLQNRQEAQTHQQDEAIRTGQAAILEKLTEINASLQNRQEAAPTLDFSPIQNALQQIAEGNQATLDTMKTLNSTISQRQFEDPAVTQLLQDMERQLLGLRTDIVTLAGDDKASFLSQHEEG